MLTWSNRHALIAAAFVAVVAAATTTLPGQAAERVPLVLHLILVALFTLTSGVRAIRTRSRLWFLIALAGALCTAGHAGFVRVGVFGGPDPAGTTADVIYGAGFLLGVLSVGWLLFGHMHGPRLWRSLSDGVLVGTGFVFIVWTLVFESQVDGLTGSAHSDQYARLAVVAVEIIVASVMGMAALYQPRRKLLPWVAAGLVALSTADAFLTLQRGNGETGYPVFSIVGWILVPFCFVAASLAPDSNDDAEHVTTPRRRVIYVAMLAAAMAAIYSVFVSGGLQGTEAGLVLAVFAALVINQILVNLELRRLHQSNQEALSRMATSERRFRAAFEGSPIGIAIMTLDGSLQLLNPALARVMGTSVEASRGMSLLASVAPAQRLEMARRMADVFRGERDLDDLDALIRKPDGSEVYVRITISRYQGQDGTPRIIGLVEDITDTRAALARLEHMAGHDVLTGLVNRNQFTARLAKALDDADPTGHPIAIAFLDLDRFKVINDSLGHDIGDELLLAIARRLTESVGQQGVVARFGGDEFTLLLHPTSATHLRTIIDDLLRSVAEPVELPRGERFHPTVSIGVSVARPGTTSDRMISEADAAMYRAKERGRNRSEFYVSSGRRTAQVTLRLVDELHRAMERDELELRYQPIVNLASGRTTGFEALLRWNHPHRGTLAPQHFMAVAEEAGLIVPIGEWVLGTAASRAATWPRTIDGKPLTVSVNVAARQLTDPAFPAIVAQALTSTGLPADQLWLETTETAIMTDPRIASQALRELRGFGLHLALDDFGTGYSSLTYLKRFPFETMKIDRSFVAGLEVNADDTAIVAAVVGLARSLGLNSVAEGVESPLQLNALRDLHCDMAQGFLLGKPMVVGEIDQLLQGIDELPPAAVPVRGAGGTD